MSQNNPWTQQKTTKQFIPQHLPQIQPSPNQKQQQSSSSQQSHIENLLPQTHKKKKRKHHKRKVRKHSPQYYQQKRLRKINEIKERNWDSHFVTQNPLQPQTKIKTRKIQSRQAQDNKNLRSPTRQAISSKSVGINILKKGHRLPQIQSHTKTTKTFNIRVVNQPVNHIGTKVMSTSQKVGKIDQKISKSLKSGVRQLLHTQKPTKQSYVSQYSTQIQQLSTLKQVYLCHLQMLKLFFPLISNRSIRQMLDKQINNIKQGSSFINKIHKKVRERQKLFNQFMHQKNHQQGTNIQQYRLATLQVIQLILKWKQTWQTAYLDVFNKIIVLDLIINNQNYLLTIMKSKSQYLKLSQLLNKNDTQTKTQNGLQIKKFKQLQNDPFMISIYGLQKQGKQMILKIRACELLLLEQQYYLVKK